MIQPEQNEYLCGFSSFMQLSIAYEILSKKTKMAETDTVPRDTMQDVLVVFSAVESANETDQDDIVVQAVPAIPRILAADSSLEVRRATFGCYKKFIVTCKGHPLSELSRKTCPLQRIRYHWRANKRMSSS